MRRSLVFGLRARNVDVLTAAEADMINRRMKIIPTAAAAAGRALLTYNTADYCALHRRWMSLRRIMRLINRCPTEQMKNRLEFLSSWA